MDRPRRDPPPPLPTPPAAPAVVVVPDAGPPVPRVSSPTPAIPPASTVPAVIREPSPVLAGEPGKPQVAPETRMLPPHQTKTERVADHVAAISADLREWTELRIALVKRQVEGIVGIIDRLQHLAEAAKLAVPGILLIVIGLMFLLVTLALGVGALIGSTWGGFAIVTALLMVIGGVLVWLGKKRYDRTQEEIAEAKRAERSQRTMSREELETEQRRAATLSAS